jgi:hypothetical protein
MEIIASTIFGRSSFNFVRRSVIRFTATNQCGAVEEESKYESEAVHKVADDIRACL